MQLGLMHIDPREVVRAEWVAIVGELDAQIERSRARLVAEGVPAREHGAHLEALVRLRDRAVRNVAPPPTGMSLFERDTNKGLGYGSIDSHKAPENACRVGEER